MAKIKTGRLAGIAILGVVLSGCEYCGITKREKTTDFNAHILSGEEQYASVVYDNYTYHIDVPGAVPAARFILKPRDRNKDCSRSIKIEFAKGSDIYSLNMGEGAYFSRGQLRSSLEMVKRIPVWSSPNEFNEYDQTKVYDSYVDNCLAPPGTYLITQHKERGSDSGIDTFYRVEMFFERYSFRGSEYEVYLPLTINGSSYELFISFNGNGDLALKRCGRTCCGLGW